MSLSSTAIFSSAAKTSNSEDGGKRRTHHHHRLWVVTALVLSIVLIVGVISHSSTAPNNNLEKAGASIMMDDIPMLERIKKSSSSSSTSATRTAPPAPALLPSPACTFVECSKSCDHTEAPYLCLAHNGGPHGGCSSVPWFVGTCTTSCDQRGCDALRIPDDMKSCEGVSCSTTKEEGGCTCEHDAPYQCLVGSAAHGCSDEAYHWTAYTSFETCSECCDTRMCQ